MAQGNNYKTLSELDYCLTQYYNKNLSSSLKQEVKEVEKNRNKELHDALEKENNKSVFFTALDAAADISDYDRAKFEVDRNGKWSKMTMDDVVGNTIKKWSNNKNIREDIAKLTTIIYWNLCAQKGVAESKELAEYAQKYVMYRFKDMMLNQLAKERVPKSSAEYICKKMFSDSLIGMLGPKRGIKDGKVGEEVEKRKEKMYNPSFAEKAVSYAGSTAIDYLTFAGAGKFIKVAGSASKFIKVANIAGKVGNAAQMGKGGVIVDVGLRYLCDHVSSPWEDEEDMQKESQKVFGDANAVKKIENGARQYQKRSTSLSHNVNSCLANKINVSRLSLAETAKNKTEDLLIKNKGDSAKLLNTIRSKMSEQIIPFNGNSQVPSWMFAKTAKQNRAYAATFFNYAMEMSKERKTTMMFGAKKMTLKEVGQRAYDYARAADMQDKEAARKWKASHTVQASARENSNSQETSPEEKIKNSPYNMQTQSMQMPQSMQTTQLQSSTANPMSVTTEQTAGWGNVFEQMGLNGFSDLTKNMGYVLAMLPDMFIGMLTGKNPNMKIEDNLLPLAAVFGGLFIKNPLLKMLFLGFGGANLFNNAGHAAIKEATSQSNSQKKEYKSYPDESLNQRLSEPVMKGSSMVVTIDGKPMVITISDNAVEAFEQGKIPLNTLANAVLRKYDEQREQTSRNYELNNKSEEREVQRVIK